MALPTITSDLFVYVAPVALVDPTDLPPGKMLPLPSIGDAAEAYSRECRARGLRVHEAPDCFIVDSERKAIARVAINGRVFAIGADGMIDYGTRLA